MRLRAVDLRPHTHSSGAVLAVRRENRIQMVIQRDRHVFPVSLVRLPESIAVRAPVVEGVEEPVADEIARGAGYPRWTGRSGRNLEHAPIDPRLLPIAQRWRS